jgi:hypothetical protein
MSQVVSYWKFQSALGQFACCQTGVGLTSDDGKADVPVHAVSAIRDGDDPFTRLDGVHE